MKIKLETKVIKDNFTDYICEKYDIKDNEHNSVEIPMIDVNELNSFDWNIGVICGNSGSGKSTILNNLGEVKKPSYDYNKSIISQFPNMSENEVCELFHSVGLSSVPTWLFKPNELSNGQRARLDLAWSLVNTPKNEIIYIDEFTSVVNRLCAESMSFSLQRYIRKNKLHIILSSCHYDIIEWLKPDWIFNLNKQVNGEVELEHIIYADDSDYTLYKNVDENDILSEEKIVKKI